MINEVTIVGYVGKDAQVQTFDTGRKVSLFRVATTKEYKTKAGETQSSTQWHTVSAWGHLAEMSIKKGMLVYVKGELVYRKYTDKDDREQTVTEIIPYKMYECVRQVRDSVPMPTESDLPMRPGAAEYINAVDVPF